MRSMPPTPVSSKPSSSPYKASLLSRPRECGPMVLALQGRTGTCEELRLGGGSLFTRVAGHSRPMCRLQLVTERGGVEPFHPPPFGRMPASLIGAVDQERGSRVFGRSFDLLRGRKRNDHLISLARPCRPAHGRGLPPSGRKQGRAAVVNPPRRI